MSKAASKLNASVRDRGLNLLLIVQLEIGEKLGKGSSGGLYKGKYLSQDVAIKIIEIDEYRNSELDSDTHVCAPASGRLQVFKQEVSIMRSVPICLKP